MYGRRFNPFANTPVVVKNLLIINILLLVATYIVEYSFHFDLVKTLGLFYFRSDYFEPYQYVTHMFMHGGFFHLLINMYILWLFGKELELFWGPKRFFTYYIITGLGAAALHTVVTMFEINALRDAVYAFQQNATPETFALFIQEHVANGSKNLTDFVMEWSAQPTNPAYINEAKSFSEFYLQQHINIPTVGASGAVYGVLLAFGMLFPNAQLMLIFPFPMPIKAKYLVIILGVFELFMARQNAPQDNVAHYAHLGGMLFGFVLVKLWRGKKSNTNLFQ